MGSVGFLLYKLYLINTLAVFCKVFQPCLHCRANLPGGNGKISPGLAKKERACEKVDTFSDEHCWNIIKVDIRACVFL